MSHLIKDSEDAYGHAVLDHFESGGGFEIIEREDGFVDLSSGPSNYFLPFEEWPQIEKTAIELAHGKVLDVGLGAGRVCLYFQEKGLKCVGIDNSPNAVRVATARGVYRALNIAFEEIGTLNEVFDTMTMFGNNFGLFGNRDKAKKMLRVLHEMTSENAVILAESVDPLQTDLSDHIEYQKWNRSRGKLPGQLKIRVLYRKYKTPWFEYLIVTQNEMKEIMKGTGWKISQFITGKGPLYMAVIEKS